MDAATPSREALWNIEGSWLVYPCFLLVLVVAAYFFWRRYRLWKIGRPLERGDRPLERLKGAFVDALLQVTVVKERGVGIAHLGMYVGMAVMVVATASYAVQVDLGLDIAKGDYYLYVLALGTDIAGLAFCIAMVACIVRRGQGPRRSRRSRPTSLCWHGCWSSASRASSWRGCASWVRTIRGPRGRPSAICSRRCSQA